MSSKENAIGCSSVVIIFFGFGFILMLLETILGFLFGGKSFISEFLDPDSEGTNLSLLRFTFWSLVVAAVIFLMAGGKIDDLLKRNK